MKLLECDQYFLLLGTYTTPTRTSPRGANAVSWSAYGPYSGQTEVVKELMIGSYSFDLMKVVKIKLPLLEIDNPATMDISELTEDGEVVELEDEQPINEKTT